MRSMLRLTGDTEFSFETSSAAYQRYVSTRGSRWPEQERLGRAPALQHVGFSTAEITLDGVIYPGAAEGLRDAPRKLRGLSLADSPFLMVTGTGQVCGFWAVPDVSDTRTVFLDNGLPRKIEFTIKLKYYGPDYPCGEGNVGALTSNPSSSLPENIVASASAAGLESLPVLNADSSLEEVAAISNAANGVLATATTSAREAMKYADVSLALGGPTYVPVACLNGTREIAQAARAILDVGQRVFDAVSAVAALRHAGNSAGSGRLNAVAATLRRNLQHTRDTARIAGYGMDAARRGLASTGQTLSLLPERQAGAGLCLEASGQAGRMCEACCGLDQDSSILLEKFR